MCLLFKPTLGFAGTGGGTEEKVEVLLLVLENKVGGLTW